MSAFSFMFTFSFKFLETSLTIKNYSAKLRDPRHAYAPYLLLKRASCPWLASRTYTLINKRVTRPCLVADIDVSVGLPCKQV